MFDISWGELLLIGVVALIVIGPKELPSVLRTVGQWMTKLRRMANEFQGQFQEAIREAEMADLKKEVDEMTEKAKSYANFDPIGDVQKEIENTFTGNPADATSAPAATETSSAAGADAPPASSESTTTRAEPAATVSPQTHVTAPEPPPAEPANVGAGAETKHDAGGKPA
jgi:sec-independent protein translocase protein TatB